MAFTLGALLPLIAMLLAPESALAPVTFGVVVLALVITGTVSAALGRAKRTVAVARLVVGGALAMLVTYAVGELLGVAIG